jgi:predicted ThiF/HesA family dinucleotide-utilizing enzyme
MAEKGEIENLIYRKDGKILKTGRRQVTAHSSKSIPRYDTNENKVRIHVMVESLGCDWGKCFFCVHSQFYSHYSLRDPEEITSEIEAMLKTGIGVFRFAGSDTPPVFGAKIAQKIKDKNLKIVFGMGSRPIRNAANQFDNLVTSYTTLIQSGLRAMFMGGETGNDVINQEVMNKGVISEDIVHTIRALREAEKRAGEKVYLSLAFIYPAPLMAKATLEQVKEDNIRLLKAAQPDSVMITPPGPFLHTEWYEQRGKFGFMVSDDIIRKAMEYEYVLYKPPHLWPKLDISLEGKPFTRLLAECNEFRNIVEKDLHIPTDISDEHFLMFYSAGIRSKEEIEHIKKETMLDIISCDYSATRELSKRVNEFSEKLTRG